MKNRHKKKQMKYVSLLGSIFLLVTILTSCSSPQTPPAQDGQITVAATFYPLYDLTKSIVGDTGTVYSIVPSGVEPHDYEPNPSDLQKLSYADAFITMGIGFAEFEEDLEKVNPKAKVIPASRGISLLKGEDDEHEGEQERRDEKELAGNDPHIWLSPKNAQKMALNIMTGLVEADSINSEHYLKNGQETMEALKALDTEFKEGLSSCNKDTILVNHNAFAYLARDYGFDVIAITGLEPEVEPTPQQLVELIEQAKEHDMKYVFYEELVDPRIARTIAQEVGAEIIELNPLEGSSDPSATYVSLMRKDLQALQLALECS